MHLVDDKDAVSTIGRCNLNLVNERSDVVDAVVGSGVELDDIERAACIESTAGVALVAGVAIGRAVCAVDGFCKDAGTRRLAYTAGATKQVGVASLSVAMAFLSVEVSAVCPTTLANVDGRYFRAETIYFSIYYSMFNGKFTHFS